MSADTAPLDGRGRTAECAARPVRPRSYAEAVAAVRACGPRGGVPRGLGRARGDAARNAGGVVLDLTALDRVHAIDAGEGVVLCDAGISLHRLARVLLPLGWCLPVTPGTGRATVGGAVAADVHGMNHPSAGSFSRHVRALELLTAEGEIHTVAPGTPLFEATAGGMGLTGAILTATLRLHPVRTSMMTVDTERARDLDDVLARLASPGPGHRYAAARLDPFARGAAAGRAVLVRGGHTPLQALPARARRDPLAVRPARVPAVSAFLPDDLFGPRTAALLHELRFRTAPRIRTRRLQPMDAFLHPSDPCGPFGGPHGGLRPPGRGRAVPYRIAVPDGREDTLRRIVARIAERRCPGPPPVLRRLGEAGPGLLSFPVPGWSLSLGLPARLPGLAAFLDGLDEEVAAAGGRVCLADDTRLRPELLAVMYPRLDAFRALRAELDPRGVFASGLSRRLAL